MKNSEKMLAKIKSRKVKPIPKWHFWAKNILFWVLFLASVKLGSLAFAVILFAIESAEFDIFSHITHSKVEFILGILPLLWILFLSVFLFGAVRLFQKTKTGYRYSPIFIVVGSFVLSIVVGTILFFTGGGARLEQKFADKVPIYKGLEERRLNRWSMPERGFLAGTIIKKDESIIIKDLRGKQWEIDIKEVLIRGKTSLEKDEKIRIIGRVVENNIFMAKEIRPWNGKRGMGRRLKNRR